MAKERLRVAGLSREERQAYDRHIDAVRVQWDVLTTAREEGWDDGLARGMEQGLARGMEQGLARGMEQGLARGMEQGLAKGKTEEKLAIARGMKADKVPIETIVKYTGLSAEEIKNL